MIRYFKKIYPQNQVTLSNGKGFTFPATVAGLGLLAVETEKRPDLIKDFDSLIARQVGGISEISQAEYEAEKKKTPGPRKAWEQESLSGTQVAHLRHAAHRANAELADTEREQARRQLTPVISRSFKRPGMKFAGATSNPEPGGAAPGQYRPGIAAR